MKRLLLVSLAVLVSGCASIQVRRCEALREEFAAAPDTCSRCLARLSEHGDAATCGYACNHPGAVAPVMLSACSNLNAPPPTQQAPAAPAASGAEDMAAVEE